MRQLLKRGTLTLILLLPSMLLFYAVDTTGVSAARPAGSDLSLPLAQQPTPCVTPDPTVVPPTPTPTTFIPTLSKSVTIAQVDCPSPTPDCVNYPCPSPTPDCVNYPCITPVPPYPPPATTVVPSVTPIPPTATLPPREEEPEPETTIVSIELQVANGKIWGLLVAENPRSGRSVTLRLNIRVPGTGTQQDSNEGFTPTGQTTTVEFAEDETNYNFSFDKPAGAPEDAEYRVDVESKNGEVGGTDSKSTPVSFDRPSPAPSATAQAPAPTARAVSPTPTPASLGNVQNPSPTATRLPAGRAAPTRQVLPTTASNDQLLVPILAMIAMGLTAAAWLIRSRRRPRNQ